MTKLESLPLFPLRTVLFPGGLLPLKVFEQRYIEMTKACLRDARPFGVCLITRGDEVARGELVPVLAEFCQPFPGYYLYYPQRRQASPALRALVDFLRASRAVKRAGRSARTS